MLFLDRNLSIKRDTAPLRLIFDVENHGRPIDEEDQTDTGESPAGAIRTYRTPKIKIDGVVLTFVRVGR